jgi:hypothetical protein
LNRASLLGEHRELHGLRSILLHSKSGYSHHPETMRWVGCLSGLGLRHAALVSEMRLRGYVDRTPVRRTKAGSIWPRAFVTEPADQLSLLGRKYIGRQQGRIPLPSSAREIWAQHMYSVMARSPETYKSTGRAVARMRSSNVDVAVARDLALILREPRAEEALTVAIESMWAHVRQYAHRNDLRCFERNPRAALLRLQSLTMRERDALVLSSTALSDLVVFA